ncbi:MAG: dihydroorotase [Ferruginibacter sp.]|nr:dihydroorotase [Ferruginibacter sp.]
MQNYLFKNIGVVNENKIIHTDVLVKGDRICKIASNISELAACIEINGEGLHLLPGIIDDQVHFREPGLTHKATIHSEACAAVAGGVTSFMEMPNTIPNALTPEILEEKYQIAANTSPANFSFFMGVSNTNSEDVLKINNKKKEVCGVKIFMGSSTGNMLVDNYATLERIFSESELLIATHCEDERIIKQNLQKRLATGKPLEPADHPIIRDAEACFSSSLTAIQLAQKFNSRLHVLHITSEKELVLFGNMLPLTEKRITAEVCVHHLHFTADDYERLGYKIKCNPAIKSPENKKALWEGLLSDKLDVIATDHAPHLLSEKTGDYFQAHAGLPLVQHGLPLMLYYHHLGKISLEKIVEKMCHAVADCFKINNRGYIREGYFSDLTVVDTRKHFTIKKENLLYKCGWSPLEGMEIPASVIGTWVNGRQVYGNNRVIASNGGQRLTFNR